MRLKLKRQINRQYVIPERKLPFSNFFVVLKLLVLTKCPNITDASISNLPEQIENMYLSDCPQLTVAMADHLPKGLKWIRLPSQLKTTKIMDSLKLKGIDASFDN